MTKDIEDTIEQEKSENNLKYYDVCYVDKWRGLWGSKYKQSFCTVQNKTKQNFYKKFSSENIIIVGLRTFQTQTYF